MAQKFSSIRYYSPGSVDEAIESHLRHLRRVEKVLHKLPKEHKGKLGLTESELGAIYREVMARFVDSAKLSEELREQRARFRETFTERAERFKRNTESEMNHLAETQAVLFARQCEKAIGRAAGDFADMLTQAVIARQGRKQFSLKLRKELWAECVRFANGLAEFKISGAWIDEAWGFDPRETPLPNLYTLETVEEQQAAVNQFVAKFRPKFEDRLRTGSSGWLNEADHRIELRRLLSIAPPHRASTDDPTKKALTLLLFASPNLNSEQICWRLDKANERTPGSAPILRSWQKRGATSWSDAYDQLRGPVKTFISTVRKEAGIPYVPTETS
jgi:hypothetical protein